MNFVALKMLMGDRIKYLSLVAGLAFAALLVTQQASIFTGYSLRVGSWIRDTRQPDLWVMDPQVEFTEASKPMADTALQRVRGIDGIEWAVPMYKGYLKAQLADGTKLTIRLVGLDDATLMGAPPEMVEGNLADLRQDRAVIVNAADVGKSLYLKRGLEGEAPRPLQVGDRLSVIETDAVVVGTYRATPEFFWEPVLYTTYTRALAMAPRERRLLTFVLVKVRPTESVAEVARRIEKHTGLMALTGPEFERRSTQYILDNTGILANFGLTIALGFIIGVLAAGQTLYTFILENLRHFAALKAMGASSLTLIRMVLLQVFVAGIIGYGIGLGAACLSGILFAKVGLAFLMPWQIPVYGAIAILACCTLAGLVCLVRVLRLEPAIVFKS